MDVRASGGTLCDPSAGGLIVGRTGEGWLGGEVVDDETAALLPDDAGKAGKLHLVTPRGRRVAVLGLGDLPVAETVRRGVAKAVVALREAGARTISCISFGHDEAAAEGAVLADYRFERYRTNGEPTPAIETFTVVGGDEPALAAGTAKARGACLCRDLTNTPASDLTPRDLADVAVALAQRTGLGCAVHGPAWLAERGFGLLLGVNAGSGDEPRLIILEHRGGDGPAVGLVGKGVCFDSGGLSLKSGASMMGMKNDMGGAAAVLGTMQAVAELALPINVTAVIPAVQNLVSATAMRPGDIHTSYAGKTVEVLNTDAEGRLILADALAYATSALGLSPLLDIATLTGACMRAVGPVFAGLFTPDDALRDALLAAAAEAGEKFWPLPLDEEFGELMKSPVADLRNISTIEHGGASSAAMFLREFVGETPWLHLDVAGRMTSATATDLGPIGGTGFAVRTLVNWLRGPAEGRDG